MSFYLHHKSWVAISEELKTSDTVIIPLGSLEPHGPHKPVGCCFLLADVASKVIGERTGTTVTPVIPFGVSTPYKNFPGTMTVSMETLNRYVYEACQNLIINGFRKIIFFSAHGGENLSVLREVSYRLREESGALCSVIHVWEVIQQLVPQNFWGPGLRVGHGGEPTTSVMLHLFPDLVNMEKAELKSLRQPMEGFQTKGYGTHSFKDLPQSTSLFAEEVETSGFMGDPTRASSEKGRILYEKLIEYLVDYVQAFKKLDPALK